MRLKLFFLLLFFPAAVFAQTFFQQAISITFSPNNLVKNISPTSDGGYILVMGNGIANTSSAVMKLDANGTEQWTQNMSYVSSTFDIVFEITECSGGGYFLVGECSTPIGQIADYITKIDASGNFLWTKTVDVSYNTGIPSLRLSGNGDYIFSTSGIPDEIIHLDVNGNILSGFVYKNDTNAYTPIPTRAIALGSDGGPLLCAYDSGMVLTKTGVNGNVQWSAMLEDTIAHDYIYPNDVISTSDGGYAIVGIGSSSNDESFIAKTDSAGNLSWFHQYGYTYAGGIKFNQVSQRSNGELVVAGLDGLSHAFIGRWNTNGNLLSEGIIGDTTHPDYRFNEIYLSATNDTGFIFAGTCVDYSSSISAISVFKINAGTSPPCFYHTIGLNNTLANAPVKMPFQIYKQDTTPVTNIITTVYNGGNAYQTDFCLLFGIAEQNISDVSVSAFPSPVSQGENISLNSSGIPEPILISVYDETGKTVLNKNYNGNFPVELPTSSFESGIYFIRITNEKNELVGTTKFVVE